MTHSELVEVAYRWVKRNTGCGIVVKEIRTATPNGEIPDVIGFASFYTILIECKTSWADYCRDGDKIFRRNPELGVGTQRFYLCPEGIINKKQLPEGWGLLWVNKKGKTKCVYKPYKGHIGTAQGFTRNIRAEYAILYSVARRMKEGKL